MFCILLQYFGIILEDFIFLNKMGLNNNIKNENKINLQAVNIPMTSLAII